MILHRFASFQLQQGLILTIQQTYGSTITVSILCLPRELQKNPLSLILETWESLVETLSLCQIPHSPRFELLCPHWLPKESHICLVGVKDGGPIAGGQQCLEPVASECSFHSEQLAPANFTLSNLCR